MIYSTTHSGAGNFFISGIPTIQPAFPKDTAVRFTRARLASLSPLDAKRLDGRVGKIQGYRSFSRKPTIHFEANGIYPEMRLFDVDPRQLEIVSLPISQSNAEEKEVSSSKNLSQEETDDLFA